VCRLITSAAQIFAVGEPICGAEVNAERLFNEHGILWRIRGSGG
jgi:hypothetical protein